MSDKKIYVKINDTPKIIVKFGTQGIQGPIGPTGATGATGPAGSNDHSLLQNLDFDSAGHTGFQRELIYIPDFKAYEIS